MTERYDKVVVILDKDIREDDIEPLLNALRMTKGVIAVKPEHDTNCESSLAAEIRTKKNIIDKMYKLIDEIR